MNNDLMVLEKLQRYYKDNHLDEMAYQFARNLIIEFWNFLSKKHDIPSLSEITPEDVSDFIEILHQEKRSSLEAFIAMMRYMKILQKNDCYIELTKYTGIIGVVDIILKRVEEFHGKEIVNSIVQGLEIPTLGESPKAIPIFTEKFMRRLNASLKPDEVKKVLAGNNHDLPKDALMPEKVEYENADTFEQYLKDRHERKVAELIKYRDSGKVWFEQKITDAVVDYVASNQEILSGVIRDGWLYITKIPYDTEAYLSAEKLHEKQYYACHCSFAREALVQGNHDISPLWCYCSGGYAKFPFEVILDQKLKIECIENVLKDGNLCRFRIPLKGIEYKK